MVKETPSCQILLIKTQEEARKTCPLKEWSPSECWSASKWGVASHQTPKTQQLQLQGTSAFNAWMSKCTEWHCSLTTQDIRLCNTAPQGRNQRVIRTITCRNVSIRKSLYPQQEAKSAASCLTQSVRATPSGRRALKLDSTLTTVTRSTQERQSEYFRETIQASIPELTKSESLQVSVHASIPEPKKKQLHAGFTLSGCQLFWVMHCRAHLKKALRKTLNPNQGQDTHCL